MPKLRTEAPPHLGRPLEQGDLVAALGCRPGVSQTNDSSSNNGNSHG
ncbi:MAG: hypothetical protein QM778_00150 [Myxococcales bacterium]